MSNYIEILMVPDYRSGNPYQTLLAAALKDVGVVSDFSNWSELRSRVFSPPKLMHIHWLEPIFTDRTWFRSIGRMLIAMIGLFYFKAMGSQFVWTVHNIKGHERERSFLNWLANRVVGLLAKHVIVLNTDSLSLLRDARIVKEHRVSLIPHGNYIDAYPRTSNPEKARDKLNISAETRVFLFFGRLRAYKGLEELIVIFQDLQMSNAILLIVGEGERSVVKNLEKLIVDRSRVRMILKFVPTEEVEFYFEAADIVVLPYKNILNSGSLWLAMSFGKTCVTPKMGSAEDLLDSTNSVIYDLNDSAGLQTALAYVCENFDEAKSRGKRAFERVKSVQWDEIGQKTKEVYLEALNVGKKSCDRPHNDESIGSRQC